MTTVCFFVIINFVARCGELSERSKEPVLKTGDVKASVGSNPTLSSNLIMSTVCVDVTSAAAFYNDRFIYGEVLKRPKRRPC